MMHCTCLAMVLYSLAAPEGPEVYEVRIKEAGKGDVRDCDVSRSTRNETRVLTSKGDVLHEKASSSSQHDVYRETVLDRVPGQRQPTRLRRDYDKSVAWIDKKSEVMSYQGKTVLIERGGGRFQFQVERAALTGAAARLLEREFNRGDDFDLQAVILPRTAVRIDEAWAIDMAPVARDWQRNTGMSVDAARSTGTGRLTRVYRREGRTYGVMTFRLQMPIVALGAGEGQVKMNAGSRVVMDVTLDCCIDGGVSAGVMKASFWVDGTGSIPSGVGEPARLTFSTRGSLQKVHTQQARE